MKVGIFYKLTYTLKHYQQRNFLCLLIQASKVYNIFLKTTFNVSFFFKFLPSLNHLTVLILMVVTIVHNKALIEVFFSLKVELNNVYLLIYKL